MGRSLHQGGEAVGRPFRSLIEAIALAAVLASAGSANAQIAEPPAGDAAATPDSSILLTVFFRHDQSRRQGFYKAFPPPGVEVVNWVVAMGIGQIVTLRLPASRIREVNRVLEDTAWGAYRTEFYPTYDYKAAGMAEHDKAQ
jgi:hypothetical protein